MPRQVEMLTQALVAVLDHLEDAPWLQDTLGALGAKHIGYGVTREMYVIDLADRRWPAAFCGTRRGVRAMTSRRRLGQRRRARGQLTTAAAAAT